MKAIGMQQMGNALTLMDIPVPKIDGQEVLVRIKTVGVGVHDRWFIPQNARYPYAIGIEAAGIIEEAGRAVTDFKAGDEVLFISSMQPKGGVWAEYAVVAAGALLRKPPELDFVTAAALPVAGTAALEALRLLNLQPNETVFMAGASGAIGTITIQVAKRTGCRVAASASAHNHDYMRSLGAEMTVDYHDGDWINQVRAWQPGGVDAALAIQPNTGGPSIQTVRDSGRLVTVSGDRVMSVRGIGVGQVVPSNDSREALAQLAAEVAAGRIHVEIEKVYPFEEGVAALEKTETRRARGKVVLSLEG